MEQNFNEIAIFYFEMGIVCFEREMIGQYSIQVTYCTCYLGVLYGKYVANTIVARYPEKLYKRYQLTVNTYIYYQLIVSTYI